MPMNAVRPAIRFQLPGSTAGLLRETPQNPANQKAPLSLDILSRQPV